MLKLSCLPAWLSRYCAVNALFVSAERLCFFAGIAFLSAKKTVSFGGNGNRRLFLPILRAMPSFVNRDFPVRPANTKKLNFLLIEMLCTSARAACLKKTVLSNMEKLSDENNEDFAVPKSEMQKYRPNDSSCFLEKKKGKACIWTLPLKIKLIEYQLFIVLSDFLILQSLFRSGP